MSSVDKNRRTGAAELGVLTTIGKQRERASAVSNSRKTEGNEKKKMKERASGEIKECPLFLRRCVAVVFFFLGADDEWCVARHVVTTILANLWRFFFFRVPPPLAFVSFAAGRESRKDKDGHLVSFFMMQTDDVPSRCSGDTRFVPVFSFFLCFSDLQSSPLLCLWDS